MILWTIQPLKVWEIIQQTGVYRCDPAKCSMPEPVFVEKYKWLIDQMEKRIGPAPDGVSYPVWAWYIQSWKHKKPDLRIERWANGPGNEQYVCIEVELPDDQVLLSDFDAWCIILLDGLLADSEEETDEMDAFCDALSPEEQSVYKKANWEKVFDVSPFENNWQRRGKHVQATFWELRQEMIRNVRFFVTAKR